jgi:hypothetical protein
MASESPAASLNGKSTRTSRFAAANDDTSRWFNPGPHEVDGTYFVFELPFQSGSPLGSGCRPVNWLGQVGRVLHPFSGPYKAWHYPVSPGPTKWQRKS